MKHGEAVNVVGRVYKLKLGFDDQTELTVSVGIFHLTELKVKVSFSRPNCN